MPSPPSGDPSPPSSASEDAPSNGDVSRSRETSSGDAITTPTSEAASGSEPTTERTSSFDFADDPESETARLRALDRYEALCTESEPVFDEITELAAYLFDAPMAMVSFIEEERQWFKACFGIDRSETGLDASACVYTIQSDGVTVIPDTHADPRFSDERSLLDRPEVRFYAGAPLRTSNGHRVGTLCVLDTEPRAGTNDAHKRHLKRLADVVVDEVELRREVRKRARREDELEQARREAEEARRTAEQEQAAARAAQQEAEEARAEAEEANAAMGRFFAGIAHDLQTPLTRIQLFADLLKKSLDDADNRYIQKIHTSGERMSAMIESLQDLAQVRSGQVVVDPEPSDVAGIAASACQAYQPDAREAGCTLESRLPDDPACASVDPDALRRVVDNLLRNALQYTEEGDDVTVAVRSDESDTVQLVVEDTGPGIPPETQKTLFDPFTRGDSDGDGMGLGLAVSKDLVEAMNGRITVESEEGQGTRFTVFVPSASPGA